MDAQNADRVCVVFCKMIRRNETMMLQQCCSVQRCFRYLLIKQNDYNYTNFSLL